MDVKKLGIQLLPDLTDKVIDVDSTKKLHTVQLYFRTSRAIEFIFSKTLTELLYRLSFTSPTSANQ
jgi:hypothetical protein